MDQETEYVVGMTLGPGRRFEFWLPKDVTNRELDGIQALLEFQFGLFREWNDNAPKYDRSYEG